MAAPHCPRCGRATILRTARQGRYAGQQFYGCSGYPRCHGIVNLVARTSSTPPTTPLASPLPPRVSKGWEQSWLIRLAAVVAALFLVGGVLVFGPFHSKTSATSLEIAPFSKAPLDDWVQTRDVPVSLHAANLPKGSRFRYSVDGIPVVTTDRKDVKLGGVEFGKHEITVEVLTASGFSSEPPFSTSKSFFYSPSRYAKPPSGDVVLVPTRTPTPPPARPTALAGQPSGPFIAYPGNGRGPTQCRDGSVSHSAGRGTCSHHGGIAR